MDLFENLQVIKAYIAVFVALSVKAVHLELVSDLTTDSFIETFHLNTKPNLEQSRLFVGAAREIKELF